MAVTLHLVDGKRVTVEGELGEVQSALQAPGPFVLFQGSGGSKQVGINPHHVTHFEPAVRGI